MSKKTVLLVEDEKPLLDVISDKLSSQGFDIVSARSCAQALDYLNELKRVDLIWLDHYLLGDKSGLDLLAEIKKHSEWLKIPIFVVSNTANDKEKRSYLKLGINNYYIKSDHKISEITTDIISSL